MSFEGSIFALNKKILDAEDMGADIASEVVDISEVIGYCAHLIWTGADPVGNIIVQASNDGINFKAVSTTAAGGAAGQAIFEEDRAHYRYVQVIYTRTSGDGELTCYISGKRQ